MRTLRLTLAAAAALPALVLAAHAYAQAEVDFESPPRAREAAEAARVKPLLDAERQRPHLGGTWKVEAFIPALKTTDGKLPPMKPAARRLYNLRIAARKAGKADDLTQVCLPPGTPRAMYQDMPFILTQAPTKVGFYHQYMHVIRHVYLDGPLKLEPDYDHNWQGFSSGWWEGDTLVIQTEGFNGKLWMDDAGLPQSVNGKLLERVKLVDPNTLEDTITVTDPDTFTTPWETKVRFKRLPDDTLITEDICAWKTVPKSAPMREYAPVPPK